MQSNHYSHSVSQGSSPLSHTTLALKAEAQHSFLLVVLAATPWPSAVSAGTALGPDLTRGVEVFVKHTGSTAERINFEHVACQAVNTKAKG
jgi:hypothetical protein